MKDLTDYFCLPNKNNLVIKSDQIADSKILFESKTENKLTVRKSEKRKLELSSESEIDCKSEKNFPIHKFRSKRSSKIDKSESGLNICDNLSICLTKIDNHQFFKKETKKSESKSRIHQFLKEKTENSEMKSEVRYLKNVLIEDCWNYIDKTTLKEINGIRIVNQNELKKKKALSKNKRTHEIDEIEGSDSYDSNSSNSVFTENEKKKRYRKSSRSCEITLTSAARIDENNLFNYFTKADKSEKTCESPASCSKTIEVVALIHSPPKTRIKLINEIKENPYPVVKIVRSDAVKICNFDDIKVVSTDVVDFSDISKNNVILQSKREENNSSSDSLSPVFSENKPWKMRVRFCSSKYLVSPKKSKSKHQLKEDGKETIQKTKVKKRKSIQKNFLNSELKSEEVNELKPTFRVNSVEDINESKSTPQEDFVKKKLKSEPKNLAPLFRKQCEPKKKPEPNEARKLFLPSGMPAILKKKLKQKMKSNTEVYADYYKFPTLNHIQQKDQTKFVWNLTNVSEDLKMKPPDNEIVSPQSDVISQIICYENPSIIDMCNEDLYNVNDEIANLKKLEPEINVADIFSSIKRLCKNAECEPDGICWTDKYKPNSYIDLIGNTGSLLKLKEWIESHKRVKIVLEADNSSSDEFIDSDDSCNSVNIRNNLAVLVGPPGCGKTSAVYMLASELGFKVLEVNAASNRNGKRLLDKLLEATQSHRVKRATIFDADIKKSNQRKEKTKEEKRTMSLILIEDADILFENYDEGFLSALSSLTSQSKRPLIFTMNSLNCPHLSKYNNSQNLILKFSYPTGSLLIVWLKLIALNEGVKLSDEFLMHLYHVAGLDLRKSLLQLQLLISSSKSFLKLSGEQIFYIDWWKQIPGLSNYRPAIKRKMKKKCNLFSDDEEFSTVESDDESYESVSIIEKTQSQTNVDAKALLECSNFFERVALVDAFKISSPDEQIIFPGETAPAFDFSLTSFYAQLNDDIADYLKDRIFHKFQRTNSSFSFKEYYNKIRQNTKIKEVCENIFSSYIPRPVDNFSKTCDYMPIIRDIARAERNKLLGSIKKSSRYFGYLKSVNIDIPDKVTDFLCNSFI